MLIKSKLVVLSTPLLVLLILLAWPALAGAREPVHTALLDGLEWRLVGPYRGGRVTTVAGVPVTEGALLRLADLKAEWSERQAELQASKADYIDVINEWARRQNVPHIASPG